MKHYGILKRGQSSIISSLMLIGAAVGLSAIVLFWGLGLISQGQSDLSTGIYQNNARIGEQFEVEDIFWDFSGPSITFYIRNFGDQPLTIDRVIIDDFEETINPVVVTSRNVAVVVSSFPWSSGETYSILIGSNRGTYFDIEATAP